MLTPERTATEVEFLCKTLKLKAGMRILDCPCGHGRHSIELARRGHDVTGQDINGFFLDQAKKAAAKAGVRVRWRKADMRRMPASGAFDVVLNLFTALGYFA